MQRVVPSILDLPRFGNLSRRAIRSVVTVDDGRLREIR